MNLNLLKFLCSFIVFWSAAVFSQNSVNFKKIEPRFNNRSVGVSGSIQGPFNTIWLTSPNGILVYDGYDFQLIENNALFFDQEEMEYIKMTKKDSEGNIWILSSKGSLTCYDAASGTFKSSDFLPDEGVITTIAISGNDLWLAANTGDIYRYQDQSLDRVTSLPRRYIKKDIQSLVINKGKELFFSTVGGRVYEYDLRENFLKEISGVFTDFPGNLVLEVDDFDKLWIGTETYGLFVYDIVNEGFVQDTFLKNTFNADSELFLTLYLDSKGYIWGGTDGGGLYRINSEDGQVELFTRDVANDFSLSSNTILDISEDDHQNIWLVPNYGKTNVLPNVNADIKYHPGSANNAPQRILSILNSSDGTIWLGTDGAGITRVTTDKNGKQSAEQYYHDIFRGKGFYIQSITEDKGKNIWFGTYKNGLWYYNPSNKEFKKVPINNSKQHHGTDVRTVFCDSKGRIWAGSNIGLSVFNANFELLATFEYGNHRLEGMIVESILEDPYGRLWFGSVNGGFYEFQEAPVMRKSVFLNRIPQNEEEPGRYTPKSMVAGAGGVIWMINEYGKLVKYNSSEAGYEFFDSNATLKNETFLSITKADNANLWFGSGYGLSHLKLADTTLTTYYSSDGFEDNVYMNRSVFRDDRGTIYFGGIHGVNYFKPETLSKSDSEAALYINTIEVLNQPIDSILRGNSHYNVYEMKNLELKHDQASFSFRFSASDNVLSHNYKYAYRLKGFEDAWVTSHHDRIATYTNIPPGSYTFEVKAGSGKGDWDIPPQSLNIIITPPFWKTLPAYLLYAVLLISLLILIRRWYRFRRKMLMEKVSYKKDLELQELTMNFFTKMSHEIQTPITLILGSIEVMRQTAEKNGNMLLMQRLNIISNNTHRLSKIARDLTLVRDKELNNLRLSVSRNDVHKQVENISLSFRELARKKQIDFIVNCPNNLRDAWYDKDKIEHVIYNLLSNAFKFTPREGNILFNITPVSDKTKLMITITDSGPGISGAELQEIFKLFYQSANGRKQKGSGIGLALTKELIDMHNGTIEVNSSPETGTSFVVILPVSRADYQECDIIQNTEEDREEEVEAVQPEFSSVITGVDIDPDVSRKTILIVEDNPDLQEFIRDFLKSEYNVLLAENGEEGLYLAKQHYPDVILSDVMMPVMNGDAMCKQLQKDSLTKHIPVILLTAKNSTNSKLTALESGAIEYLNKPFNTNELLLKVRNILTAREHIISNYKSEALCNPEVNIQKSKDEVFLEDLVSLINEKIADADLKMEELAESLHMSYSSFYRKCQAVTGYSIIDFVRLIRLKKGAIILAKYGYSISEVAYLVGFNDPKYFSKCFKKQFGRTPKVFANEAREEGAEQYLEYYNLSEV